MHIEDKELRYCTLRAYREVPLIEERGHRRMMLIHILIVPVFGPQTTVSKDTYKEKRISVPFSAIAEQGTC